ncbi:hypothetical protein NX722_14130 [Endozoicomonas gorgoniicola]|uniref:VOC domain-containing protein n=1 Tax=Endozoicomonas gorgoniicola TaxID=1234144 RepID=A0ABT3MWJ4_9GAMM|nr:hypothetical protein [Endozoicomonas gorgoniicola]MCW7553748.1 hypothetical protein [Endozoicomonas gorgoniicola]
MLIYEIFGLTDIQPVYDHLIKQEFNFYRDLEESWYEVGSILSGQKEFLIQDPDGYLLRFTQYLGEKECA